MIKIFMISLGCAKNLVDAETMLGETLGGRYVLALDPAEADIIIVNTCGFIQDARDEARSTLLECLAVKEETGGRIKVAAAGCWAQREPEKLLAEFPGLDAVWGLDIPSALADSIESLHDKPAVTGLGQRALPRQGARLVTTLPSYAYLRLSDGCDNRCHYCAIPLIRGPLKSRSASDILDEAKSLEDQGAKELVLISQDTTAFGMDRKDGRETLATLLEKLLRTISVPRLRLLYAHPAHLDNAVMDLLRNEPRFGGYLDLPIQHIATSILERMGRGYSSERVYEIIERLGPAFTLRTTLLLGFPGETEEEFGQALDLVKKGFFRHLGAFSYSPEPGTPAFTFPDQVPADVAAARRDAILSAQSEVAFAWLDSRIGGTEEVVADSIPETGWLLARSRHEAPDADGVVFVKSRTGRPGDTIMACITGREGYDLIAETRRSDKKRPRPAKRRR